MSWSSASQATLLALLVWLSCVLNGCSDRNDPPPLRLISLADRAPKVRSLDGSSTHFYLRDAQTEEGATTWVVWLQGGSDCETEAQCKRIVKNGGGTGKNPDSTHGPDGPFIDPDKDTNPDFWDANHVYLPYITADFHAGTRCGADPFLGKWYFCGHQHLNATVTTLLEEFEMKKAKKVIFGGCSAGGMGTFRNLDWLRDVLAKAAPQADVRGVALAGFYFFQNPFTGPDAAPVEKDFDEAAFKRFFNVHQAFVDDSCRKALAHKGLEWMCQQAPYSNPYITTPVFAAEFQTDIVQLTEHAGVHGDSSQWSQRTVEYVAEWATNMTSGLQSFLQVDKTRAVFSPACFDHCNWKESWPKIKGQSVVSAVSAWLRGDSKQKWLSDTCKNEQGNLTGTGLLCNPTCGGHMSMSKNAASSLRVLPADPRLFV